MNKIGLIFRREFLNRVQKKSFLIATIMVPLLFPTIMAVMIYFSIKQEEGAVAQTVEVLDLSGKIQLENSAKYKFVPLQGDLAQAREIFKHSSDFALLYIPPFELSNPEGITVYSRESLSIRKREDLESALENRVHDLKLEQFNIDKETLKSLKTDVNINSVNTGESGEEDKENDTGSLYILGVFLGVLIYMFVIIYGMQIMQGVIEEKTSKIVEVIISSVKPFQLMMGKILGIAAVGLLQFTIWAVLITAVTSVTLGYFGMNMPQQQAMEQVTKQSTSKSEQEAAAVQQNQMAAKISKALDQIPVTKIIFNFAFYFLGGYLLYGALFAAVGSAVDSAQEAQQFTLPIMMPLIIAYAGLFMFILNDPHSTASFWFSIIPFTSPVAMVGRLAFDVPTWQLILSQVLLIGGFIFTTWIAGRIYRVGILMSGSKVNYKVLAKWFMMKS
jgi:ABC-2 type transport system permease protein